MNRNNEIRNDLDDLILSAEQIDELSRTFNLHALQDMLFRLHQEIRAVRRELLLIDADSLISLARNFGDIA